MAEDQDYEDDSVPPLPTTLRMDGGTHTTGHDDEVSTPGLRLASRRRASSGSSVVSLNSPSYGYDSASSSQVNSPTMRPLNITSPAGVDSNGQPLKAFVFLGGSCDPTTWRADLACHRLQEANIPFYNPQVENWEPELIELETNAKENCDMLLFVIDGATRAIASMLEATEYILRRRHVALVIQPLLEGTSIDGEIVKDRQLADLNRARAFLFDIANRNRKHCTVFSTVEKAVDYVISAYPRLKDGGGHRRRLSRSHRSGKSPRSRRRRDLSAQSVSAGDVSSPTATPELTPPNVSNATNDLWSTPEKV